MAYAQVQIYEHAQPQIQNYKHAQPQAWHAHLQLHINKHAQPQAWHAHLQEQLHGAEQWAMAGTYRGQWHAQAKVYSRHSHCRPSTRHGVHRQRFIAGTATAGPQRAMACTGKGL
eukprot:1160543-Pelagomonas_calceolata.AAC.2